MGKEGRFMHHDEDAVVLSLRTMSDVVAARLFKIGVVKTKAQSPHGEGYKLKDHEKDPTAPLSPVFLDFRLVNDPKCPGPVSPENLAEIGSILYGMARINRLDYGYVCAVPNSANPYAKAMSEGCPSGRIHLLKLSKEVDATTGEKRILNAVDGKFKPGESVLLVTEVIDRGQCTLEAARVLEANGLRVYDILAIVDRSRGGSKLLRDAGYNVYYLFGIEELLELYMATHRIPKGEFYEVMQYLAASK
ncbi:MAG: uridine monophosphate synthetase [Parcubacteria group bacterium Gr01-1014_20]|nr:MAG: uridine monophosphate synthetase [Parcubacteria group bacterium Gr01-1014_20]